MVRSVTISGPADAAVAVAATPLRNVRRRIPVLPGGAYARGVLAREWSRFYRRRRRQCRTSTAWFGHNPHRELRARERASDRSAAPATGGPQARHRPGRVRDGPGAARYAAHGGAAEPSRS